MIQQDYAEVKWKFNRVSKEQTPEPDGSVQAPAAKPQRGTMVSRFPHVRECKQTNDHLREQQLCLPKGPCCAPRTVHLLDNKEEGEDGSQVNQERRSPTIYGVGPEQKKA